MSTAGPKEQQVAQLRADREAMREERLAQIMKADTKKPGKVPYVGKPATGQGDGQTAGSGRPPGRKDRKPRKPRRKATP